MTEYELAELINGITSNIIAGQAVFLSILSAYLIVAYSAGKNLTPYQVGFINFIFIAFVYVGFQSQLVLMGQIFGYSGDLAELRGTEARFKSSGEVVRWLMVGIRLFMGVGALLFMWHVRHPKTD
jgi:hypothetical protein